MKSLYAILLCFLFANAFAHSVGGYEHLHVDQALNASDEVNSGAISNAFTPSDDKPLGTVVWVRFKFGAWRAFVKTSLTSNIRWTPLGDVFGGDTGNGGGGTGTVTVSVDYSGCVNNKTEWLISHTQTSGPTILNWMAQKSTNNSSWSDLLLSDLACLPQQLTTTTYIRIFGVTASGNTDYATATIAGGWDCDGEEAW